MKRLLLVLFVLITCLGGLAGQFSGGSGTEEDPYLVANATDLNNVRSYLSSHFRQTADIDLNIYPFNEGTGWNPIGTESEYMFQGSFDGNGYTIQGLYINNPNLSLAGLFGFTWGSHLKNIVLLDVDITCYHSSGALLGHCHLTDIFDCFASGEIIGTESDTGGLVGILCLSSTMSHCSTDVSVTGNNFSAGLAGWANNAEISDCHAVGTVNGDDNCGGLIGDLDGSTLIRSYAINDVYGIIDVGGLVGICQKVSTITDCFSRCNITATDYAGGISGSLHGSSGLHNCFSASCFEVGSNLGGITGYQGSSCLTTACYWNTELSGPTSNTFGEGRTTAEMTYPHAANTYVGWDFVNVWHNDTTGWQNNGYPYLGMEPSAAEDDIQPTVPIQVSVCPNPFRDQAVISGKTNVVGMVDLAVYNLKGQRIRHLAAEVERSGEFCIVWDGRDDESNEVCSGLYFVRLSQAGRIATHRFMLIK